VSGERTTTTTTTGPIMTTVSPGRARPLGIMPEVCRQESLISSAWRHGIVRAPASAGRPAMKRMAAGGAALRVILWRQCAGWELGTSGLLSRWWSTQNRLPDCGGQNRDEVSQGELKRLRQHVPWPGSVQNSSRSVKRFELRGGLAPAVARR
jgi:hypothetical protein